MEQSVFTLECRKQREGQRGTSRERSRRARGAKGQEF